MLIERTGQGRSRGNPEEMLKRGICAQVGAELFYSEIRKQGQLRGLGIKARQILALLRSSTNDQDLAGWRGKRLHLIARDGLPGWSEQKCLSFGNWPYAPHFCQIGALIMSCRLDNARGQTANA